MDNLHVENVKNHLLFFYSDECPYCAEIWPDAQRLANEAGWILKGIKTMIIDDEGVPQVPALFATAYPEMVLLGRDCVKYLRSHLNER